MVKFKVLVIDSDASARALLVDVLSASETMEVVGVASSPMMARMQVKGRKPDVLVLTLNEGAACADVLLTEVIEGALTSVVMLSSKALPGSDAERKAVRSKRASILLIPNSGISVQDKFFTKKLIQCVQQLMVKRDQGVSVKQAALSTLPKSPKKPLPARTPASTAGFELHRPYRDFLIAIGASTGGTEALRHVVSKFEAGSSAVLIVQHIPVAFASSFILQLDKASPMIVVAAEDGTEIHRGHIYVGAGSQHLSIERQGMAFVCRLGSKDKVSGHCPSVNVLFDSVAKYAGAKAVGALMTGMGDDGATGLKKMRDAKAKTVAQDKASSVVWGMPGAAVSIGGAEIEVALDQLGDAIVRLAK